MLKNLINIYKSKKEVINYIIFGVLTTLINLATYYTLTSFLLDANKETELQIANVISWLVAVLFAYITNRKYVFESKNKDKRKEIKKFFTARLLTLIEDMIIMYLGVSIFKFNDKLIKFLSQITVIVTNYVLSKLFVFKKEKELEDTKITTKTNNKDILYIVIPAYNEEENISDVVKEWHNIVKKINKKSKLVIIDDGSKDNTYDKLLKLTKKYSQLEVITKENEGHGATVLYGYNYAIKNKADYIFQTDSDGQTLSFEFWQFWEKRDKYNAIIGSRKNRQDGLLRILVTKVLKLVLFCIFHTEVEDANTPFRLIKRDVLKECLKDIPPKFNLSNVLLSILLIKKDKEKIKFIPITFRPRQGGTNSINLRKIIRIGTVAIKDFRCIKNTLKSKKNSKKKIKLADIIPYFVLFILSFIFLLSSNMSPIGNKISGVDSSVFRYIGTIMTEGKIPYVDVFDHKGILLYIINYIGVLLNKNIGIWIIELVFLFVTSIFAYKLAKLFTNKFNSILAVILSFIPLIYTFEAGNLTEEYALPFITISLYLFTKDLKEFNAIKFKNAFLIGLSLGAVLLLRLNMIVVWICMSIYILILYLKKKDYKYLFKTILYFLIGIIIFILPFIIYLLCNNALNDFIYQYLIFNFKYIVKDTKNTLLDTYLFYTKQIKYIYLIIIIYLISIFKNKDNKRLMFFYLSTIVLSLIIIITPRNLYSHYGMIIIPTFIVAFSIFIDFFYNKCLIFFKNNILKKIILILILLLIISSDIKHFKNSVHQAINKYNCNEMLIKIIQENSDKEDNVLIFGNNVTLYLQFGRRIHQKYVYQLPVIRIDKKVNKEFFKGIYKDKPKLIIMKDFDEEVFWSDANSIKFDYEKIYIDGEGYVVYKIKT